PGAQCAVVVEPWIERAGDVVAEQGRRAEAGGGDDDHAVGLQGDGTAEVVGRLLDRVLGAADVGVDVSFAAGTEGRIERAAGVEACDENVLFVGTDVEALAGDDDAAVGLEDDGASPGGPKGDGACDAVAAEGGVARAVGIESD